MAAAGSDDRCSRRAMRRNHRPHPHRYGDDPSQFGELSGAGPVAVLIHGGFWRDRYDLTLMEPLAADLVARGWAAWNIEYRRLGSGGGVPETLDDVAAAIDFLAELDGVDLSRVVAIGHSAGGSSCAATSRTPRSRRRSSACRSGSPRCSRTAGATTRCRSRSRSASPSCRARR
jgi:acetyl esterase/lipase